MTFEGREDQVERNRQVMAWYHDGKTMEEIAVKLGRSRERVRQILDIVSPTLMRRSSVPGRLDKLYNFLVAYKRSHDGNSPSLREIIDTIHLSTETRARLYLERLEEQGRIRLVTRDAGERRSYTLVEIVGARWVPPIGGFRADAIILDEGIGKPITGCFGDGKNEYQTDAHRNEYTPYPNFRE